VKLRQNIVAVAYDKRGRELAVGVNSYSKTHPLMAKFSASTENPHRVYLHAELVALLKGSKRGKVHHIHVVRIKRNGSSGLAKPCSSCSLALKDFGVKSVTWST